MVGWFDGESERIGFWMVYQSSYISGWGPAHTRFKKAEIKIILYFVFSFVFMCVFVSERERQRERLCMCLFVDKIIREGLFERIRYCIVD